MFVMNDSCNDQNEAETADNNANDFAIAQAITEQKKPNFRTHPTGKHQDSQNSHGDLKWQN